MQTTAEFYLTHPAEFYLHLGRGMRPAIKELTETQFLEILDAEFHKYGTAFLKTSEIQAIFRCNKQDANICIKFYTDYYDLPLRNADYISVDDNDNNNNNNDNATKTTTKKKNKYNPKLLNNKNLNLVAKHYNIQGERALTSNNISKLLDCSISSAIDFIRAFCNLYNLPCPIKGPNSFLNDKKILKQLDKEFKKHGAEFFTTQNIMQKLKCGRVTANKIVKKYSEKYNFQFAPIENKKYKEEYLVAIYYEYLEKGIFALNVEHIKKRLAIPKDETARRYIKKFCNLYGLVCPTL